MLHYTKHLSFVVKVSKFLHENESLIWKSQRKLASYLHI